MNGMQMIRYAYGPQTLILIACILSLTGGGVKSCKIEDGTTVCDREADVKLWKTRTHPVEHTQASETTVDRIIQASRERWSVVALQLAAMAGLTAGLLLKAVTLPKWELVAECILTVLTSLLIFSAFIIESLYASGQKLSWTGGQEIFDDSRSTFRVYMTAKSWTASAVLLFLSLLAYLASTSLRFFGTRILRAKGKMPPAPAYSNPAFEH